MDNEHFNQSGSHLIVITKLSKVGDIHNQAINRIEDTEVIPFSKTSLHLTDQQIQFDRTYQAMVKSVLETPYFYFSYSYDLSHTLQRLYNAGPDFVHSSLFERVSLSPNNHFPIHFTIHFFPKTG